MRKPRAVHRSSVEVTRHDLAPLVRGLCQNIVEQSEANTRRIEDEERRWKYDTPECIGYRAVRVREDPPRWRAEALSGLPPRVLELSAYALDERSLEAELRFRFAREVMAMRLVRDWDDARARAAKVRFLCAEVVR